VIGLLPPGTLRLGGPLRLVALRALCRLPAPHLPPVRPPPRQPSLHGSGPWVRVPASDLQAALRSHAAAVHDPPASDRCPRSRGRGRNPASACASSYKQGRRRSVVCALLLSLPEPGCFTVTAAPAPVFS